VDKPCAFELDRQQLSRLLAAGIDGEPPSGRPVGGADGSRPSRAAALREALSALMAQPCDRVAILQGRTTGSLLLDRQTDPAILRLVKEHGKTLVRAGGPRTSRDAAVTVYYAAIASALVHHREKITHFPHGALSRSFRTLCAKRWIPVELRSLFAEAQGLCEEHPDPGPGDREP